MIATTRAIPSIKLFRIFLLYDYVTPRPCVPTAAHHDPIDSTAQSLSLQHCNLNVEHKSVVRAKRAHLIMRTLSTGLYKNTIKNQK